MAHARTKWSIRDGFFSIDENIIIQRLNPDGSRTLFIGGIYEVRKNSAGSVTGTTTYYPAGGAVRSSSTLYFMLKDHLGSTSIQTDSIGNVVGDQRYYPFGETRLVTGTMYTNKLFTGQREMTGAGIYYYGAWLVEGLRPRRANRPEVFTSFHIIPQPA